MADTTVATANRIKRWDSRFFSEYVRNSRFAPYMGTDENACIQLKDIPQPGEDLTISLIGRLSGAGVTGNVKLEDAEENLDNFGQELNADWLRNGVLLTKKESMSSPLALRDAARTQLMSWSQEKMRDETIDELHKINGISYATATAGQRDNWLEDNTGRILFGAALANTTGTDHSASLANVDNTTDKLTTGTISLAKRRANTADPHIRPIRTDDRGGEEWYILFVGSLPFRDLKADTVIQQALREGWVRGRENPLFKDGDLIWDGVIIREVPEIGVLTAEGAGGIDVSFNALCGAQAVGVGWQQRTRSTVDTRDYDFRKGVGIEESRAIEKLQFKSATNALFDHGVFTLYTAAVADA